MHLTRAEANGLRHTSSCGRRQAAPLTIAQQSIMHQRSDCGASGGKDCAWLIRFVNECNALVHGTATTKHAVRAEPDMACQGF